MSKPRTPGRRKGGLPPPPRQIDSFSRIDPETIAVLDNPDSTEGERLTACRLLIRYGELGRALTYVSAMLEDAVLRPHAEVMLAQIRTLKRLGVDGAMQPAERAGLEQGMEDVGYWVVPADSRTTVIAFTGKAMRLDISIYFMQRILKRFGVNVIYVFDWTNTYYFAGVKGLGDDFAHLRCAAP